MNELTPHFFNTRAASFKSAMITALIAVLAAAVFLCLGTYLDSKTAQAAQTDQMTAAVAAYPPICDYYGTCKSHKKFKSNNHGDKQ